MSTLDMDGGDVHVAVEAFSCWTILASVTTGQEKAIMTQNLMFHNQQLGHEGDQC